MTILWSLWNPNPKKYFLLGFSSAFQVFFDFSCVFCHCDVKMHKAPCHCILRNSSMWLPGHFSSFSFSFELVSSYLASHFSTELPLCLGNIEAVLWLWSLNTFIFLKDYYLNILKFLCVWIFSLHVFHPYMWVYCVYDWYLWWPEEGTGYPGAGVIDGCKLLYGCWILNPSLLQEQWMFLTGEPALKGPI